MSFLPLLETDHLWGSDVGDWGESWLGGSFCYEIQSVWGEEGLHLMALELPALICAPIIGLGEVGLVFLYQPCKVSASR